jgi:hypothetical protein
VREVRIDPHTLERAQERGTDAEPIREVVQTGIPVIAGKGRLAKFKVYDYHGNWRGRFYEQQLVKVIYVVDDDAAVTITVVVHYGRWEEPK